MAFQRKTMFGTSYKQISSITEAQGTGTTATLFDKIIWMIKSWCNTTFALKSHNHTSSQITNLSIGVGLPDWSKKKLMTGTSYTCPSDGWIFLQPTDTTWTKLNGITIAYAAGGCGGDQTVFPVSKNDVVMLTNGNNGTSGYNFESRTRFNIRYFVPFK